MVALPLRIRAIFQDGKFIPREPCLLPESSEVDILVESPHAISPVIIDRDQRAQALAELVARMQANPLPPNSPRFTREELHERR